MINKFRDKYLNKYLLEDLSNKANFLFLSVTTIFTFFDVPSNFRCLIFVIIIFIITMIYITKIRKINHQSSANIFINSNNIQLECKDIFSAEYTNAIKIIPFNEYFDTQIDDYIISKDSLNGKYINNMLDKKIYDSIEKINSDIDKHLTNENICRLIKKNENRTLKCKINRYELGSLCYMKQNYCLLSFSKFDKNNNAYLTNKYYFYCLLNMWDNLNKSYNQRDIVIPLLGGGITRFNGSNSINNQDLLKMILATLKWSNKKFNCKITILIPNTEHINLYNIQKTYNNM